MTVLRVATWNLDRSGIRKKSRITDQLKILNSLEADILILTETHDSITPDKHPHHASSKRELGYHEPGESCVAIWSRFELKMVTNTCEDPYLTVCAEIHDPVEFGNIIVYGTIITYGGDGVREKLAKHWERHRAAVKLQTAEWKVLRQRYPNHLMIVAGDFNENLNQKRWYGVKDAKAAIKEGLASADMLCPTAAEDITLLFGNGELSRCTVDHICVSKRQGDVCSVRGWEGSSEGVSLSDHNGVLVDIECGVTSEK